MNRRDLLQRLKEYINTDAVHIMRLLLLEDLSLKREKNDAANYDDVLKNQGAIVYIKNLAKELDPEKDQKLPIYDGGFGD